MRVWFKFEVWRKPPKPKQGSHSEEDHWERSVQWTTWNLPCEDAILDKNDLVGRRQIVSWQMAVGSWQLADSQLAVGSCQLAVE
jgi:hypothetical protein